MEKAILVGLHLQDTVDFNYMMAELKSLCEACEIVVLETIIQKMDKPTANFYIGPGKVEELKAAIINLEADLVVFDDELSPTQVRNLEKALQIKVIDRTVLILDIFARRAKTKEAMLQVELAQCEYMLPRVIVGANSSFSRQRSGTGSKGPGEKQLELDRRFLKEQISRLHDDLKELVSIRRTQREKRKKDNTFTVAITGYTNSGKSTLLNKMLEYSIENSEKYVFEKNMLFATLETATRAVTLKNNHRFLITDTVGFISKLPHHLIEAFKSTLEEIKEATLILHVIDSANSQFKKQVDVVEAVLKNLEAKDIPVIYVLNKLDLLPAPEISQLSPCVSVSAVTGEGFPELIKLIDNILYNSLHRVRMIIPFEKGNIYSFLKDKTQIFSTEYLDDGIHIDAELNDHLFNLYKQYII
ncbi:MAG: GTPase HflX [Candidatus Izemoplasmatales bacterium]|nr:GTPase HflX [Candidatus Izemoplasmatales bacterium]MDD4595591.1 GTPase HflX [Candidatus Izemoplasmatales bacterium]